MNKKTSGIITILGIILLGGVGLSGRTTESAQGPRNIPTPLTGLENTAHPTLADLPSPSPVHRELAGVHGRVLDAAGLAVAGATVMAFPASRSMGRCCNIPLPWGNTRKSGATWGGTSDLRVALSDMPIHESATAKVRYWIRRIGIIHPVFGGGNRAMEPPGGEEPPLPPTGSAPRSGSRPSPPRHGRDSKAPSPSGRGPSSRGPFGPARTSIASP